MVRIKEKMTMTAAAPARVGRRRWGGFHLNIRRYDQMLDVVIAIAWLMVPTIAFGRCNSN
jgi:hypothetical protein